MADAISLTRSGPAPFAPAPKAARVGDYIFTSSIYPIDAAGHAVGPEEWLGEAGPSAIEVQTRHCLDTLKTTLADAGGSLERVLKVDVHLADPADFFEFKLVWREYFPAEPPARTTVEVGDTLPFRGARISIDAVALASDAAIERIVLRDPDGPDPLGAEWASAAIHAGNLVFRSGFTASDFQTGIAVGRPPGFPYFGREPDQH